MADGRPSLWTTLNLVIKLLIVVIGCATAVWLTLAAIDTWQAVKSPVGVVKDVGRAVLRMEQPRSDDVSDDEADAHEIAAAVAIDTEGEHATCLGRAQLELVDITLRAKKRLPALSYRQIVGKAISWIPDNWDYPFQWQDRDASITAMSRSETVKELIPIVRERMRSGPGEGCAAKIIRAKFHWAGFAGGERRAANVIRTYPKDPRFQAGECQTDFRCLPN